MDEQFNNILFSLERRNKDLALLIVTGRIGLYDITAIRHTYQKCQDNLKRISIKHELNKPFLQKLYEMKGSSLHFTGCSYFFSQ